MAKKRDKGRTKVKKRKPSVTITETKTGRVLFSGSDAELKRAARTVTHRVTTHGANGNGSESMEVAPETVPIGEAMRLAVEALGDVKITDDLAPSQMRELADCYEDIVKRTAVFNAKNDEAKTAKKSLESATEMLLERVKAFTHPSPLPLFDNAEREDDLTAMRGAGDVEELGTSQTPKPEWGSAGFNGVGH